MTNELLRETPELTLDDICQCCAVSPDLVISYVREGLVDVEGEDISRWRFSQVQVVSLQKAVRLEHDLRLNHAGAVLVMELLDEIEALKKRLARFERGLS